MAHNSNGVVDLRSDTVTKPCEGMLASMMQAQVGDDVYGEDPSVNALELKVAKIFNKEAAIFVPSGTMANQIAIALHTNHGDSVIAEEESHCYLYEAGAAAALSGVQFQFVPWSAGYANEAIDAAFKPEWMHYATSKLLVIENSHNRAAGRVFDKKHMDRISSHAKTLGLKVHCDGARIWNAAVATQTSEADLAQGLDSIACCFSKGLGAPVGSALVGGREFIEKARKIRKRWGGAMRQSGFLAQAAIYALDNNRAKLANDHANIAHLANALMDLQKSDERIELKYPTPGTNLLYFRSGKDNGDLFTKQLQEKNILLNHLGEGWLRAVSHWQVSTAQMNESIEKICQVVSK